MKGYDNRLKIKGYDKIKKLGIFPDMWNVVETDVSYLFTKSIIHLNNTFDITNKEITHSLYRSNLRADDTIYPMVTTISTEDGNVLKVVNKLISIYEIGDINEFVKLLKWVEDEILQ
jgi:hypothetical protein